MNNSDKNNLISNYDLQNNENQYFNNQSMKKIESFGFLEQVKHM